MLPPSTPMPGPLAISYQHMFALRSLFIDPIMTNAPSDYLSAVRDVNSRGMSDDAAGEPRLIRLEKDGYSIDKVAMVTAETDKAVPFSAGIFGLRGSGMSGISRFDAHNLLLHGDFELSGDIILRAGIDIWPSIFPDGNVRITEELWLVGYPMQHDLLLKALLDDGMAAVFEVLHAYKVLY